MRLFRERQSQCKTMDSNLQQDKKTDLQTLKEAGSALKGKYEDFVRNNPTVKKVNSGLFVILKWCVFVFALLILVLVVFVFSIVEKQRRNKDILDLEQYRIEKRYPSPDVLDLEQFRVK